MQDLLFDPQCGGFTNATRPPRLRRDFFYLCAKLSKASNWESYPDVTTGGKVRGGHAQQYESSSAGHE